MKKIKLIYNSGAGQSKFKYFLDVIIEKFMENNCDVSVFRIDKNTNLYEYLKDSEKEGVYGIVVAGGDGTVDSVVNAIQVLKEKQFELMLNLFKEEYIQKLF